MSDPMAMPTLSPSNITSRLPHTPRRSPRNISKCGNIYTLTTSFENTESLIHTDKGKQKANIASETSRVIKNLEEIEPEGNLSEYEVQSGQPLPKKKNRMKLPRLQEVIRDHNIVSALELQQNYSKKELPLAKDSATDMHKRSGRMKSTEDSHEFVYDLGRDSDFEGDFAPIYARNTGRGENVARVKIRNVNGKKQGKRKRGQEDDTSSGSEDDGKGTTEKKLRKAVFYTWCRPKTFIDFAGRLSEDQVRVVNEMGFGGLLKLKMFQLKRKLIKWVTERFHINDDVLMLDNMIGVPFSYWDIADYFGIPVGKEIFRSGAVQILGNMPSWSTLTSSFRGIGSGDEFRIWFLHMACCTLLDPTPSKTGCNRLYKLIKTKLHIAPADYNWAEFVFSRLKDGIKEWRDAEYSNKVVFSGFVLFFQVAYLLKFRVNSIQGFQNFEKLSDCTNETMKIRMKQERVHFQKKWGKGEIVAKSHQVTILGRSCEEKPKDLKGKPNFEVGASSDSFADTWEAIFRRIDGRNAQVDKYKRHKRLLEEWIEELGRENQNDYSLIEDKLRVSPMPTETNDADFHTTDVINLDEVSRAKLKDNDTPSKLLTVQNKDTTIAVANAAQFPIFKPRNNVGIHSYDLTVQGGDVTTTQSFDISEIFKDNLYQGGNLSHLQITPSKSAQPSTSSLPRFDETPGLTKVTSTVIIDNLFSDERYHAITNYSAKQHNIKSASPRFDESPVLVFNNKHEDEKTNQYAESVERKSVGGVNRFLTSSFMRIPNGSCPLSKSLTDMVVPNGGKESKDRPIIQAAKFSRIKWIIGANQSYSRMVKNHNFDFPFTKNLWNAAHYIFCTDTDCSNAVLARCGNVYVIRKYFRTLEPKQIIHSSVVDLYVSFRNVENCELCFNLGYRTKYFFSPRFTRDIWNLPLMANEDSIVAKFKPWFESPEAPKLVKGMFFLPHCINNHWSFHLIDTSSKLVTCYDSNMSLNPSKNHEFSGRLVHVLNVAFKHYCPGNNLDGYMFKHAVCTKQKNSHDSGPMMLKLVDRLSSELTRIDCPVKLDAKSLEFYRIEIACRLLLCRYNELLDIIQEEVELSMDRK